jgi:hypothetical protein
MYGGVILPPWAGKLPRPYSGCAIAWALLPPKVTGNIIKK